MSVNNSTPFLRPVQCKTAFVGKPAHPFLETGAGSYKQNRGKWWLKLKTMVRRFFVLAGLKAGSTVDSSF
jgi:hypothetical protein